MTRWLWILCLPLAAQNLVHEREAALGTQMAAEVRSTHKPITDPTVQSFVNRVVADLSPAASVEVLTEDSCRPAHDAMLLPGGHLFVPAPLLLAVRNDAELTAALSHALAHDTHPRTPKGGSIPLLILGSWQPECPVGQPVPSSYTAIHEENERKADARAANPGALLAWLERNPQSPELDRRIAALRTIATATAPSEPTPEFVAMQEALRTATAVPPRRVPTLRRP